MDHESRFQAALAQHRAGRLREAEVAYVALLKEAPEHAAALHHLGALLHQTGRSAQGITLLLRAEALLPGDPLIKVNLGLALKQGGRFDEAIARYRAALEIDDRRADAWDMMGNALREVGRVSEGMAAHRRALELDPERTVTLSNVGSALFQKGEVEAAVDTFRQALARDPSLIEAHSNLIFALDLDPRANTEEQQAERKRWWERHGRRMAAARLPHANVRDPERRLRVGYVSADFCGHSAAALFGPIVRGHDPVAFETVCYSGTHREDAITASFKARAALWRPTLGLDDDRLAALIRSDRVDILVDLSGHSAGNRMGVFARKPAPVQVSGWGHGTGTGLPTVDVLISDPVAIPAEERALFPERIVDLPCSLVFDPADYAPPVAPAPCLANGYVAFGSLNRMAKTSEEVLRSWGALVASVPDARLLLKDRLFDDAEETRRIAAILAAAGLAEDRFIPMGGSPHREHLAAYGRIDIGLDPFPQGGGVTTLEALWQGVPVITLIGHTIAGRFSAGVETALGLTDFVAQDLEAYRSKATAAADADSLAALRSGLRGRLAASPIADAKRYVTLVEALYRELWRRCCVGLA
ncbi:MAG: tetratricopeptide repeat protein [Alphaproteobacteria bacterium]|nr:tetratricopeptide repeat protein [Alphaproteobacteria bacterium]